MTQAKNIGTSGAEAETQQGIVVLMVALNAFSTPLMLSATIVALPAIGANFSLTAVGLSWVPMAYLMASAMFVLVFGRVADRYGRKRLFLLGSVAVIAASIFTAMSVNSTMLILGRFLQGVSAAMLYATQMAIISSVFPPERRGRAIGLVVAAVYIGLATGPLLGGVATDLFGWRASFFLHIPLALIVLMIGLRWVKQEWHGTQQPLDLVGALLFGITIALLCLGVSRFPTPTSFPLLGAFLLGLVIFSRHALARENAIWDLRLFTSNAIFRRSCGAAMIMYTATYANMVLLSLYLQQIKSLSASQTGMILMIQPLLMALLSPTAGKLSDRLEPRLLATLGMMLTFLGLLVLSRLDTASSLVSVALALASTGVGFSLFSSPNTNAIMGSVARGDYGSASATVATTRILGQLASMVLVAFAMALVIGEQIIHDSSQAELAQALRLCFTLAAAICVPGMLLSASRGRLHSAAES